ncbi:MAG TPA: cysteine--tRNA ligase [Candidatus Saccharimonadales bacterium]|nr:cysteine--tRNA ligase [Candidatus Saccharimonadales bacterium]
MKLYNTASRKVEEFSSITPSRVKYYSCGPTVYDKPTIGNWASFVRYDILARALKADGYTLEWIMNITDVGHLVSDADEGEDKMEKTARKESKTAWEIAEYYGEYFIRGLDYFNISIPRRNIVKATRYIDQQLEMIKILEKKGHTYPTDDGIYFDSTTFSDYGKMAKLDLSGQKAGARVETGAKKHPSDFALWKFSPKDKKRDMEWDSPWGKGFPGWHLECSAIILSELGETIDIHAGGIEHIPIHHTNEIAQSESTTGKQLAGTWVHNNHLQIEGQKISKSLGNGYTMEDLQKKGYDGKDFRMFVMSINYRNEANFTWQAMEEARRKRLELQAIADLRYQPDSTVVKDEKNRLHELKYGILDALEDNLDTAKVIELLGNFSSEYGTGLSRDHQKFIEFLMWLDNTLGFELLASKDIDQEQKKLIKERSTARKQKDWQKADKIRGQLEKQDIALNDISEDVTTWYRTA